MILFLITLSLIFFSIIANFFSKQKKIFIIISIFLVFSFYFFLTKTFYNVDCFYPSSKIQYNLFCSNYYNLIIDSLKEHKLYIGEDTGDEHYFFINKNDSKQKLNLLDTSTYKDKIYLYFGITPVLLFYLPFNFITKLYLTDKFLVFILSCLIFILSLFLIKKTTQKITDITNLPINTIIIIIFFIGFCNLLPFLLIRSAIYEVAISNAIFLLLISFCLFYYFIYTESSKKQKILTFFLSLTLCLAVGARPYYVLFIPVFFFFVIYIKYKETKNLKHIFKITVLFLIPCVIYGLFIAIYNYVRFDSIFEFGFKYQINHLDLYNYKPSIKDFLIGLKNNLFLLPDMNEKTIFSLTKTCEHRLGNDYITGAIWMCPIIFILSFVPFFLKKIYKKDKKIFFFLSTMTSVIIISVITTSFFGMVTRYIFEYLSIMIILSVIIYIFYVTKIEDCLLKNFFNLMLTLFFAYSFFINISLLLSIYQDSAYYSKEYFYLIKILF